MSKLEPGTPLSSVSEILDAIHIAVIKAESYWKDRDREVNFHLNSISYDLGRAKIALQKTQARLELIRKEKPNGKEH